MSNKLVTILINDIANSRKNGNVDETVTLSMILSDAKLIALNDKRKELKDADVLAACIKNNKEAIEAIDIYEHLESKVAQDNYLNAVRLKTITERFLPAQLSEAEILYKTKKIISDLNAKTMRDMGKVMSQFKSENPAGTFDAKYLSSQVKSILSE